MSDTTITALPTASTIDPINDYLAIDTASPSVTNKINRNVLLGVTGTPADLSTIQIFTNKVIGNTNTLTVKDSLFTLQDDGDTSKQAKFQLSGITTATTRTYTLPNASVTLASLTGTETLTSKTITSPVITGGSIDNTTITVDSISGHTTPTIVTVGGVQLNNGTIGTTGAVITASILDAAVTPAKLIAGTGANWALQTYSPTFTNVTPGNGSFTAYYNQTGKMVFFRLKFVFGSTTVVSGSILLSLPVAANAVYSSSTFIVGQAWYDDAGTQNYQGFPAIVNSTSTMTLYISNVASTYPQAATNVAATVPHTWTVNDSILVQGFYEAA